MKADLAAVVQTARADDLPWGAVFHHAYAHAWGGVYLAGALPEYADALTEAKATALHYQEHARLERAMDDSKSRDGSNHHRADHVLGNLQRLQSQCGDDGGMVHAQEFSVEKDVAGTAQKSRYTKMPMKHNLCIGCIEKRLGRRLKRCDFALNDPHNNVRGKRVGGYSRRLRDRLRG